MIIINTKFYSEEQKLFKYVASDKKSDQLSYTSVDKQEKHNYRLLYRSFNETNSSMSLHSHHSFLNDLKRIILSNIDCEEFTVESLAKCMGMSHSSLYKRVKDVANVSVNKLMRQIKLEKAAEMLIKGERNITEVAYAMGFSNIKYFRTQFKKMYKMTPTAYKKRFNGLLNG